MIGVEMMYACNLTHRRGCSLDVWQWPLQRATWVIQTLAPIAVANQIDQLVRFTAECSTSFVKNFPAVVEIALKPVVSEGLGNHLEFKRLLGLTDLHCLGRDLGPSPRQSLGLIHNANAAIFDQRLALTCV